MRISSVIVAIIISTLSSCTVWINVPKKYPPEIITVRKPEKIVFVNNFNYTNKDIVNERHQVTFARAVNRFSKGFASGITPSDSIIIEVGDTLRRDTEAGMLTTLLPIEVISGYCDRFQAGMMVVLDSINLGFDSRADFIESVSYVNIYSRTIFMYGEFFLSAYAPDGELINRCSVTKDMKYSWRMAVTSEMAFAPSIAAAARKIDRIALPAGTEYASKFHTVIVGVQRKVYNGGGLNGSVELMKTGKWNEAVETLRNISSSSKGSLLKHAKVNLEVAKEGAGIQD